MEDWEGESPSDEGDINEIENELYSMFYYHSTSDGVPEDLSKKFCVDVDGSHVSISLNDKPVNQSTKCSGDQIAVDNSEIVKISNDRYIDGRKGCRDQIIEKVNVSVSKDESEIEVRDPPPLSLNLPSFSLKPVSIPPSNPRNSKFQSSRYFSNTISNSYTPKSKFVHKADSNYGVSLQQVTPQRDLSGGLFQNEKLLSSTPLVHNRLHSSIKLSSKKAKKSYCNSVDNIKVDCKVIDLTSTSSRKPKRKKKTKVKIPVITISSESEDDSDDLQMVTIDSDSESEFSESYSNDESFDSILLNTSMPVDYNYSDISVINMDYDWRQTSSPEGWTQSMRKFYNKPSKKHLDFDYNDILQEMRSQGSGVWTISNADLNKFKRSRYIRCLRCQEEGHVKANCTKIFSCHMCGTPGHSSRKCPQRICLKCGSKCHDIFPSSCDNCVNNDEIVCSVCGLQGHNSKHCTELWRSLSLIKKSNKSKERSGPKYCCHCAKSGHYYEDCRKMPSSTTHFQGGDITPYRESFKKKQFPKHKRGMKNIAVHDDQNLNFKTAKFIRLRSNMFNSRKNEKHFKQALHHIKKTKNSRISKRILMLRKSNKKKKFKACLSNTI